MATSTPAAIAKPHRTAQGLVDASGKERLLQSLQEPEGRRSRDCRSKDHVLQWHDGFRGDHEDGGTKAFNIRGVISKDNRYSRLWVDAKVDGQTTKAEVIVPEGHTAVRKLPGENSWLL